MISVLDHSNAKSNNRCKNDITSGEGSMKRHILNFSSSCIDLILIFQQILIMESGVFSSPHPNCHHQVVSAKFNLSILYPPPYKELFGFMKKQTLNLSEKLLINLIG